MTVARPMFTIIQLALSVGTSCTTAQALERHLRGGAPPSAANALNDDVFALALREESTTLIHPNRRIQTSDVQDVYIQDCESYLLDPSIANDGIISQTDFANMLLYQCHLDDGCADTFPTLKFEQLDLNLQLKFINGICYHDLVAERVQCIKNLNDMWIEGDEFGFVVDGTDDDIDMLVHEVCSETYVDAVEMGLARSLVPTVSPSTSLPTRQPSPSPSFPPTEEPSLVPTNHPASPTKYPSSPPSTHSPSISPGYYSTTQSPTQSPSTSIPSIAPVASLSLEPSTQPTYKRRIVPTTPFVNDCASYLLSPNFLEDGIISQMEFTRFLIHHCIQQGLCDDRTIITFEELNVGLQLEFILGVCSHEEQEMKAQCIRDLEIMWREGDQFGFDVNDNDMNSLLVDVKSMCEQAYDHVVEMGLTKTQAPAKFSSAPPSTSPLATPLPSQSQYPSKSASPSTNDSGGGNLESTAPASEDTYSRGAIVGMAFGLALTFAAAYVVYVRHHRDSGSPPDKLASKDANHFGTAAHEPWGKAIGGLSYMGINCSMSSSSSSFRDYRFVTVFSPQGTPIPQFNPNNAGAVVIGSVTIGGGSSYSSGPFVNTSGSRSYSSKAPSFFSIGKVSRRHHSNSESGASSKDDMSSLSSYRSSSFRKSPKYKAYSHSRRKRSIQMRSYERATSSRSKNSRNTVPMTHQRRRKFGQRVESNDNVSFGEWRAISYMTQYRHPSQTTNAATSIQQNKFFFDTLLGPESNQSPDINLSPKSCQSLPNECNLALTNSFDAGVSSILSESFFQEGSSFIQPQSITMSTDSDSTSHRREESFVPWRKEGFSSSLQLSDSRAGSESVSSSSADFNAPESKKVIGLARPFKTLFAKYRKKAKGKWRSTKHKQYHHINRGQVVALSDVAISEDGEVASMERSWSSNTNLLPPLASSRTDLPNLPNLVLGTWAAASMPIGNQYAKTSVLVVDAPSPPSETNDDETESVPKQVAEFANDMPSVDEKEGNNAEIEPPSLSKSPTSNVMIHISSLDMNTCIDESFSAYSKSDFGSSSVPSKTTGDWTGSSYESCASSSSGSSDSSVPLDCSFAAAIAPLDRHQDDEDNKPSHDDAADDCVIAEDVSFPSTNSENFYNVNTSLDDESKGEKGLHLIGISQHLSESESTSLSSHSEEFAQNETNIISNSSGAYSDEAEFPSDEDNSTELSESKDCGSDRWYQVDESGPLEPTPQAEEDFENMNSDDPSPRAITSSDEYHNIGTVVMDQEKGSDVYVIPWNPSTSLDSIDIEDTSLATTVVADNITPDYLETTSLATTVLADNHAREV